MTVGVLRSQFVTSKTGSIHFNTSISWLAPGIQSSSRSFWRNHQLPDRIDQILNRRVMCIESLFKFPNFRSNLSICCQHLSHFYESPYNKRLILYSPQVNTVAAIIAPCSVKAYGAYLHPPLRLRSQFATSKMCCCLPPPSGT